MEAAAIAKLELARAARAEQLRTFLASVNEDLQLAAESPQTREALLTYDAANGPGSPQFAAAESRFNGWFSKYARTRGYYDIFLINAAGHVLYTVAREPDFNTNLKTGAWSHTGLARAVASAMDVRGPLSSFADYESYAPSNGDQAGFVAAPIRDLAGNILGAIAFQLPKDRINAIMSDRTGLGATGVTYLTRPGREILSQPGGMVPTVAPRPLFDGRGWPKTRIIDSEQGSLQVVTAAPLAFPGTSWILVAQMNRDEIMAPVHRLQLIMIAVTIAGAVILSAVGVLFVRTITRPIKALTAAAENLARDEPGVQIPAAEREDEIGTLARSLVAFRHSIEERDRLRQAAADLEAERASHAAKARFLRTIGHELRTPLNGILGMAHLLESAKLEPDEREYLALLELCGKSLSDQVSNILTFVYLTSGQYEMDLVPVNVRDMLSSIADDVLPAIEKKRIGFSLLITPGTPDVIWSDADKLNQFLGNLVDNAIKFTAAGEVRIHVEPVTGPSGEAQILIEVSDTGIGIAPAKRAQLFAAFSPESDAITRSHQGAGLGLAVTREIITLMHGSIDILSEPGEGTTCRVILPVSQEPWLKSKTLAADQSI